MTSFITTILFKEEREDKERNNMNTKISVVLRVEQRNIQRVLKNTYLLGYELFTFEGLKYKEGFCDYLIADWNYKQVSILGMYPIHRKINNSTNECSLSRVDLLDIANSLTYYLHHPIAWERDIFSYEHPNMLFLSQIGKLHFLIGLKELGYGEAHLHWTIPEKKKN